MDTTIGIIIPIVTSFGGLFFGFVFRMCWERRINKKIKYDEIMLNSQLEHLKEKSDVYWSIYVKLLQRGLF